MNDAIICCVDGSESTNVICEYAAWIAGKLDAPIALLHVIEKDEHPAISDLTGNIGIDSKEHVTEALVKVEGERSRQMMAQGKAILAECAALLEKRGCSDVQLLQKHGTLKDILADLENIRLIVMGRRGSEHVVGSQLEDIIRLQKKPVLVATECFKMPSQIMISYDGSEASYKSLTHLANGSLLKGLTCHLVMVKGDAVALQTAQNILQKAQVTLKVQHLNDSSVTDALCKYADDNAIDLTIMGAYGHSRLRNFFIGSHTTEMLMKSRQPLLMFF